MKLYHLATLLLICNYTTDHVSKEMSFCGSVVTLASLLSWQRAFLLGNKIVGSNLRMTNKTILVAVPTCIKIKQWTTRYGNKYVDLLCLSPLDIF
jgi:hypothetical protein